MDPPPPPPSPAPDPGIPFIPPSPPLQRRTWSGRKCNKKVIKYDFNHNCNRPSICSVAWAIYNGALKLLSDRGWQGGHVFYLEKRLLLLTTIIIHFNIHQRKININNRISKTAGLNTGKYIFSKKSLLSLEIVYAVFQGFIHWI